DQNPWDAAEYIRKLIQELSARTDQEALTLLDKHVADSKLATFHEFLKHNRANQLTLKRSQAFLQPGWSGALAALRGDEPAHVADLFAFSIERIRFVAHELRMGNTDGYKSF